MGRVFRVNQTLNGCNSTHPTYPLLPDDLIVEQEDGSFQKTAPGLAIGGFRLSTEEFSTLTELDEHPPIAIGGWSDFLS